MSRLLRFTAIALAVSFTTPGAAQDLEAGVKAAAGGDFETARKHWEPLAEQGRVAAQLGLGMIYDRGQGVPQDYAEATRWYRLAAEQGDAVAQSNLAAMYADGKGVQQDYAEAIHWFRLAAAQGDAVAQCRLGRMYADGRGVPQDYVLAHMWLNLAAAKGDDLAVKIRDELAEKMTPELVGQAHRKARACKSSNYQDCD